MESPIPSAAEHIYREALRRVPAGDTQAVTVTVVLQHALAKALVDLARPEDLGGACAEAARQIAEAAGAYFALNQFQAMARAQAGALDQ